MSAVTLPPIAISGRNYVEMGQPIHLFCNATGPDGVHLSIDWFKDGDRIDHYSYRHILITNYNLVETKLVFRAFRFSSFRSATHRHSYTYVYAKNMSLRFLVCFCFEQRTTTPLFLLRHNQIFFH